MKLNEQELKCIVDDLAQCERRDDVTMNRADYTETSRGLAKERQSKRRPLLTKLRMVQETASTVDI